MNAQTAFCRICGAQLHNATRFCGNCGNSLYPQVSVSNNDTNTAAASQNIYPQAPPATNYVNTTSFQQNNYSQNRNISRKEYADKYAPRDIRNHIRSAAIIGYISSAVTLIFGIVFLDIFSMVSALIILGVSLGLHLTYQRGWAIALVSIGGFGCLLSIILSGSVSSYLIIAAGVGAIISCNTFEKSYQQFISQ